MPLLSRLSSLWRNLSHKDRVEQDLTEEIRAHLEMLIELKIREGLDPAEARHAALIELGGEEQVKERVREARRGYQIDLLFQEIRYSIRSLARSPAFTLSVMAVLALGIGANTAIFSVVNAVLIAPAKKAGVDPEHQYIVFGKDSQGRRTTLSYPDYRELKTQCRSCEEVEAYRLTDFTVTGREEPFRVGGLMTSSPSILGVKPLLGRFYSQDENKPGAAPVVILNYLVWQKRFSADPHVIGRNIILNDRSYTIIGVLPSDFEPLPGEQMHVPLEPWAASPGVQDRHNHEGVGVSVRSRPGVSYEQMRTELEAIMARLAVQYPETNAGLGLTMTPILELQTSRYRTTLWMLLGAVSLFLLLACANVANLYLARSVARRKEVAIRLALGAPRRWLIRQSIIESLILALAGGILGGLLGWWGAHLLQTMAPTNVPRLWQLHLDVRVLGWTCAISVVTGLLFGLAPALQIPANRVNETLKLGGRGAASSTQRIRGVLLVTEMALAIALMIGTGLLVRSLAQLQRVELGFQSENVLTMEVALDSERYSPTQRRIFYEAAQQRLSSLPGVTAVGVSSSLPLLGAAGMSIVTAQDQAPTPHDAAPRAAFQPVSAGYFDTLGIRLLRGRVFGRYETADSAQVAVVNESLARRFWPTQDPLGKRIKQGAAEDPRPWREVIGVVSDVRQNGMDSPVEMEAYLPIVQDPPPVAHVSMRTHGPSAGLALSAKQTLHGVDPDAPVYGVFMMEELLSAFLAPRSYTLYVLGVFAALALVLVAVGIYGTLSYLVAQRTQELGVRMALGARPSGIILLVTREALKWAIAGSLLGSALAIAFGRFIQGLLFGVGPSDPLTIVGVCLAAVGIAIMASYLPARRASRIDPVIALRTE
jgi:putative ABC transport system permease protein